MWHWLLYVTGTSTTNGSVTWLYNFWSGFGSDIAEVAIFAGIVGLYRKHNCGEHGCWRLGRHEVNDTATGERHIKCRHHIKRHLPSDVL